MLPLYFVVKSLVDVFFLWLYLIFTQIVSGLLFYPTGIVLSLFLLLWILRMLVSMAVILRGYIRVFLYWTNLSASCSSEYFWPPHNIIYFCVKLLSMAAYFFSTYLFVFHLKRVEVYIFWIFVIFFYFY